MKSFLNGFLTVFLILATLILLLSLCVQNIILDNLSTFISKDYVKDYLVEYVTNNIPEEFGDASEIEEKIENSDEIDSITDKYYDTLINDIKNNDTSDITISKELDSLIDTTIEGKNLTSDEKEELDKRINNDNFNELYQKLLSNIRDDLDNNDLVTLSKYLIDDNIKYGLIIVNVVLVLLLIIVNKSLIRTFANVGIDLITSGLLSFIIFPLTTKYVEKFIEKDIIEKDITINASKLFIPGLILMISGVILLIIHAIYISKKTK